jgi:hypothetical protein
MHSVMTGISVMLCRQEYRNILFGIHCTITTGSPIQLILEATICGGVGTLIHILE